MLRASPFGLKPSFVRCQKSLVMVSALCTSQNIVMFIYAHLLTTFNLQQFRMFVVHRWEIIDIDQ